MLKKNVIVIGTSAGGIEAMKVLVSGLLEDLRASLFVVLHMGADGLGILPEILERSGPLPAANAKNWEAILAPHEPAPSADDIIDGYKQLIARAHLHGMRIIGATLTPFEDTFKGGPIEGYYNTDKEQKREAVNQWIRSSGAFDGVIDFDAMTRDPNRPTYILAAYDCGDHLHPNDAGYKAMADSVDLKMLTTQP